jgi:hypothetical protein
METIASGTNGLSYKYLYRKDLGRTWKPETDCNITQVISEGGLTLPVPKRRPHITDEFALVKDLRTLPCLHPYAVVAQLNSRADSSSRRRCTWCSVPLRPSVEEIGQIARPRQSEPRSLLGWEAGEEMYIRAMADTRRS